MDRRTLPALAVGMALVMLWYIVFVPWIWPPPPPGTTPPPAQDQPTPPAPENGRPEVAPVPPDPTLPNEPAAVHRATFGNLQLTFDNRGAKITEMKLADHGIDLVPADEGAFVLRHAGTGDNLEGRGWKMTAAEGRVEFEIATASDLTVRKVFEPGPTPDQVRVTILVENPTAAPLPFAAAVDAFAGIEHDGNYRYESYLEALAQEGTELRRLRYDEDEKRLKAPQAAAVEWFGLKNRYFIVAAWPVAESDHAHWLDLVLEPREINSRNENGRPAEKRQNVAAGVRMTNLTIEPGQTTEIRFDAYAGPLKDGRLPEKLGDPDTLINWTLFDWVGRLLVWLIGSFKNLTGNWGIGIILATIAIRICISPLTIKSQSSMMKMGEMMKKLKPQLDAIRERHSDDPQKLQEETMALYRKEGINPLTQMGGCLPMFIQMPIFIGMYSVLDLAVDLRQQPFFGWIGDLSQPDRLVPFDSPVAFSLFCIPFYMDAINLLPVLMGITWTVQSYLTPMTATDPQQVQMQKMMRFMPIMFVFFCYNLASGLSLYFFVNSLLSIIETKFVRKHFIKPQS